MENPASEVCRLLHTQPALKDCRFGRVRVCNLEQARVTDASAARGELWSSKSPMRSIVRSADSTALKLADRPFAEFTTTTAGRCLFAIAQTPGTGWVIFKLGA